MKRIEKRYTNEAVLKQSRSIRNWFVLSLILVVGSILRITYELPSISKLDWFISLGVGIVGAGVFAISLSMLARLPEAQNRVTYQNVSPVRLPFILTENGANSFRREDTGLDAEQWSVLSFLLRERTGWRFSRGRLRRAGMEISNADYQKLNEALTAAEIVVNNQVPESKQHWFMPEDEE